MERGAGLWALVGLWIVGACAVGEEAFGAETDGADVAISESGAASTSGSGATMGGDDSRGDKVDVGVPETTGEEEGTDGVCEPQVMEAQPDIEPVDIILVVDTTASMDVVSSSVEANLGGSFASVIDGSGVDYRVIAIASRGDGPHLCLPQPLGDSDCDPAPQTNEHTDRLVHYDRAVGSGEMLDVILAWYTQPDDQGDSPNGWRQWLRPEARKVFVAVTDAYSMPRDPNLGTQFDANLLSLDAEQFGTTTQRRYVFHTIAGLAQNDPATAPWLAGDPLITTDCVGFDNKDPGEPLQQVSIITGGLRYPLCEYESFDLVFEEMADGIATSAPISCGLAVPEPSRAEPIDLATLQVEYFAEGGSDGVLMRQVDSFAFCEPNAFYVEDEPKIQLCPGTCSAVQGDLLARMEIRYGCDVGYEPRG